jgi:RHS repeat-associated protein
MASVKDGNGNSFTLTPHSPSGTYAAQVGSASLAYILSAPSNISSTITVTLASSVEDTACFADSFQVASGYTAAFDSDAAGSGSSTAINTPSITPAASSELFYSVAIPYNHITAVGAPWTVSPDVVFNNGSGNAVPADGSAAAYDLSVSSALAVNMTASAANQYDTMEGAIEATSGGSGGNVSVSVSPSSYNLSASQTGQFTATVTGSSNQNVTWSISPDAGSISSSGLYTAPSTIPNNQTVTVTATSQANSTASGSATVSLTASASGPAVYYYSEDQLGTSRVITTSTGTICYDADFYPYGGERDVVDTCPQNYKFDSKERDAETGNDDFGARYYTSRLGRWLSADWSSVPVPVPYANLSNPQTLNLYAMVHDNPETFADLDGHCCDIWDAVDFVAGALNAYGSDNLAGVGRQQQETTAGRMGAAVGDAVATFEGSEKVGAGGAMVIASVPEDATGEGALLGVPQASIGSALAAQGSMEASQGGGNLLKSALGAKAGESGGPGAGKDFNDKTKAEAVQENQSANGGQAKCVFCGENVGPGTDNKTNIDHAQAKANGGTNNLNNANVTCEYCNKSKGKGSAPKTPKQPDQD